MFSSLESREISFVKGILIQIVKPCIIEVIELIPWKENINLGPTSPFSFVGVGGEVSLLLSVLFHCFIWISRLTTTTQYHPSRQLSNRPTRCPFPSFALQHSLHARTLIYFSHPQLEAVYNDSLAVQEYLISLTAAYSTDISAIEKWRPSWNPFSNSKFEAVSALRESKAE